jgi:hypothetical protein
MAAMKIQEEAEEKDQHTTETPNDPTSNNGMQSNRYRRQTPRTNQITYMDNMVLEKAEEAHVNSKRPRLEADNKKTANNLIAGPAQQASQRP